MTKLEIADAIRAALDRYAADGERLWSIVNNVGLCAHELAALDEIAADELRLLNVQLTFHAALEDQWQKPGSDVHPLLAEVRRIADRLGT
jgi:hypothetical protein